MRVKPLPLLAAIVGAYYAFAGYGASSLPFLPKLVLAAAVAVSIGLGYYHVVAALGFLALFAASLAGIPLSPWIPFNTTLLALFAHSLRAGTRLAIYTLVAVLLAAHLLVAGGEGVAGILARGLRGLGPGGIIAVQAFSEPLLNVLLVGSSTALLLALGFWAAELSAARRLSHPALRVLASRWLEPGNPERELMNWSIGFTLGLLVGPILGLLVSTIVPVGAGELAGPSIAVSTLLVALAWRGLVYAYSRATSVQRMVAVAAVAAGLVAAVAAVAGPEAALALVAEALGAPVDHELLTSLETALGTVIEDSVRVFDKMLRILSTILWGG